MSQPVNRRSILRAGVAASGVALGSNWFDFTTVTAAGVVRRDVGNLKATDQVFVSYAKAIKAMKALPASNPLSWSYQAAIHGTTASGSYTAWNTCEHGTYFFWSWHRMYLYWFEKIIRKMSGDYGWALPYWNWSSASERQLPPMFRVTTSELYVSQRDPNMNNGTGSLPASDVDYSVSFGDTGFTQACLYIQGTPHGDVHVDVGGWMGSVPTAAQDPIFYLHHCNIDRLWNLWLAQGGGRTDPLNDATWKNTKFTFFDENGAQVQMTGCDVLRAAEQLNYTYEGEPTQVKEYCTRVFRLPFLFTTALLFQFPVPPITLNEGVVSVPVNLKEMRTRLTSLAVSTTETLLLELDGVEAEKAPGVVWEVYLGLPANTEPDPKGPYYAGNVSLFGMGIRSESHHEFKPATVRLPIGKAVTSWLRTNGDTAALTFVPHGVLVNGKPTRPKALSPVKIAKASIVVDTKKTQE